MTQATQHQPVQTPEQQPGFLRRGIDAASSMPLVLGARVGAHNAVEKTGENIPVAAAIGATTIALMSVGVSEAKVSESQANGAQAEAGISAVEGSRQVVKTALSTRPIISSKFIWKKKNGKRVPTKKLRLTVSDTPANPGNPSISPEVFLDQPIKIDLWQENRRKGSKAPRKRSSSVGTIIVPSSLTSKNIFARTVTIKLDRVPNLKRDDWVVAARETADPIVGGPQSKKSITKKATRLKAVGPVI